MKHSPSDIEKKLAALATGAPKTSAVHIRKRIDQHDRNQKSLALSSLGFFQILLAFFAPVARLMREQNAPKPNLPEKEDERKF
ncbi:MAG: hypothetical protein ACI8SR_000217 [Oceanicoccus sp.]|jgi:hypothetical protein